MRAGIISIFILFTTNGYSQEFNVKNIPDSLLTHANAVKRYEEFTLEIKSPGKFISHERHVYTIMNEQGEDFSKYHTYYDQFTTIDYLSAILYDSNGKVVRKLKRKDLPDHAISDDETILSDNRVIDNNFNYRIYPYTVDYEESDTRDGVLNFPGWEPVSSPGVSTVYTKYTVIAPKNYDLRYKELNFKTPPVVSSEGGKITYTWEMQNIPAAEEEPLAPPASNIFPYLMVAPSDFDAQGYKGNMSNWKSYGEFIYNLKKGRDVLPDDVKKKVHELTDQLKDPKQKIKVLYQYLQQNTRYISIQLGIGGWQPLDATYVAKNRYGDCKALSNFMIALLKEAGITGKYVEISAGENADPIITDFSEFQFDHVICCVPLQHDTVWLECTSQTLPAGYLSGFTQNRYGLMSDENGGRLVHTPKYDFKENLQIKKIKAVINEDGNLTANITEYLKAMDQDELEGIIAVYPNDKIQEYLKSSIDLPSFETKNIHFEQNLSSLPSITVSMEVNAENFAQVTGKRLFITPNILTQSSTRFSEEDNRKFDIELHHESTLIDSVEIAIPQGYTVESAFHDINLETEFGKFSASAIVAPGKIIYYRKREYHSGRFPKSDYSKLVDYYDQVYKSDHSKIVLIKQD